MSENDGSGMLTDGIRKMFLAGVGAAAIVVEKSEKLVDVLVEKGESTVNQGKEYTAEVRKQKKEDRIKRSIDGFVDKLSTVDIEKLKEAIRLREEDEKAAENEDISEEDGNVIEDEIIVEEIFSEDADSGEDE